jgi:hypothetical protein
MPVPADLNSSPFSVDEKRSSAQGARGFLIDPIAESGGLHEAFSTDGCICDGVCSARQSGIR